MSAGAALLARVMLGLPQKDVTSGFRCYRKEVVERLIARPFVSGGYAFQEESLFRCVKMGAKIVEVPITFAERTKGRSKLGWRDIAEFFRVMFRISRER